MSTEAWQDLGRIQLDLMHGLAAANRLEDGLLLCLEAAMKASGLSCGGVYLFDAEHGSLDLLVHQGISQDLALATAHFEPGTPQVRLVTVGMPLYSDVEQRDWRLSEAESREGLQVIAVLPIRRQGQPLGCLNVASRTLRQLVPSARLALETIAASAGEAIARLRAQEALRESEARYRALFDDAVDGILLLRPDGKTIAANAAFARMHGYESLSAMRSFQLSELDTPDTARHAQERLRRVAAGEVLHFEVEHYGKDGSTIPLSVTASRVDVGGAWYVQVFHRDMSEQKRAQAELRRWADAFEHCAHGIALGVPGSNRVMTCNAAFARMLGRTVEDVAGQAILSLYVPEDHGRIRQHQEQADRTGLVRYESRMVRADGTTLPVQMDVVTVRDASGRPLYRVATAQDVSERNRLEEEREGARGKYRTLFEALPVGATVADGQGRLVESNRIAEQILGLPPAEQRKRGIGGPEWDIVRPDGTRMPPEEFASVQALQSGRVVKNVEMGLVKSTAETTWISVNAAPLPSPERGVVITYTDISARKRAEEALRERENQLKLFVEHIPAGLAMLDRDMKYLVVSRRWLFDYGISDQSVIGRSHYEVFPEIPERWKDIHRRCLAGATEHCEMDPFPRADGSVDWVRWEIRPWHTGQGEVGGIIVFSEVVTARKRAEDALRESEEEFRTMFDVAAVGMAQADPHTGQFLRVNQRLCQMTGYSEPELLQRRIQDITHPEDREHDRALFSSVVRGEAPEYRINKRFTRQDGGVVWVNVNMALLRDADGRPVRTMATIEDITERKRSEARAAREVLRTRFLLELHQRAPQMADAELYDHVLDRAVQLTGSAIGFFHQVSEDQSAVILTAWNQEALKTCHAVFNAHYPLRHAGNWADCVRERRPVIYNDYARSPHQRGLPAGHAPVRRFMSIPVFRDGKLRMIFGVGNKETDYDEEDLDQLQLVANELHKLMVQRLAQRQLRESEERFRHLVETSYDWVWQVDAEARYTYASPRVRDLLGYSPEEVLGRTPFDFMPEAEVQRVKAAFSEIAARREPFSALENVNRRKDGREVVFETSGAPVLGPRGELLGYRGMDRDVSERRRMEAQLREAQKLEAIGQLAGGVAHDFNNILAAIMMHLGLIEMNPSLDEETAESVRELNAEAGRAAALTRQLLMFSRRSVLAVEPQDLNELAANLLKMLTRLIPESIRLSFDGASQLPSVEADGGMMEQVLVNLVVNARDAMPTGGRITIGTSQLAMGPADVAASPERREGRFVCLAVSDTGCGMDAETVKHIFEPFFTTKEAGKGTGLGLATVYGIVAQHKGWVEVQSAVGQGTTFRVFLEAMAQAADRRAETAPSPALQRGQECILLVEDDLAVRRTVCRSLQRLGYRVLEASNGQEAMNQWKECGQEVDLLLTDMVMPEGLTGLELAERLQRAKPELKVIISSGYSTEIVEAGAPDKAGVMYLPKPYLTATLAEAVRSCLRRA